MKDFFNFKKMISPILIKIIYVIGAVTILFGAFSLADIFMGLGGSFGGRGGSASGAIIALFILILGELFWRIACENMIIFFSIHEILSRNPDSLSNTSSTRSAAASQNRSLASSRPQAASMRATSTASKPSAPISAASLKEVDDPILTPPPWSCPKCKKRLSTRICPTCKYRVP